MHAVAEFVRMQADYEAAERKRLSNEALNRLKASYQIHFDDAAS